jgi:hypothetical protein
LQVVAEDADLDRSGLVGYTLYAGEDPVVSQLFGIDEESGWIVVKSSLVFAGQSRVFVCLFVVVFFSL